MKMLNIVIFSFMILTTQITQAAESEQQDWRKNASTEEKVQQMIDALPGASTIMLQMGERYKNLYWAAKMEKWDFAIYQLEEIEELVKTLQITRPKRANTAQEFIKAVYPALPKAVEARQWAKFEKGFELLRTQCMACHSKNAHAFITLPIPKSANSPVLNLQ